jgi:hypothetical protein
MNKIKLYHYSNIDIRDYIKPDFYGLNYFTSNDKAITNVKRAFYYTKPEPEHLLRGSKFLYTILYSKFRLYDISADLKGYLKDKTISEALHKIKQDYNGIIYRIGNIEIVNLFYRARFIKKERL